MDEPVRIPIDLGYAAVAPAASQDDGANMTVREDGTIVIDILSHPECGMPDGADIVVCGAADTEDPDAVPPPAEDTLAQRLGEGLHTQIGPLEIGSIDRGDGTRSLGARIRF